MRNVNSLNELSRAFDFIQIGGNADENAHVDVRDVLVWADPNGINNQTEEVFFGHDGGISKAVNVNFVNNTGTWQSLNGTYCATSSCQYSRNIQAHLPFGLGTSEANGTIIFGHQDNDIVTGRENDRYNWTAMIDRDAFTAAVSKVHPNFHYYSEQNGGVMSNFSGGTPGNLAQGAFHQPLLATYTADYAASRNIFKAIFNSNNTNFSWEPMSNNPAFVDDGKFISAIAAQPYDGDKIAVCKATNQWDYGAKIYLTTNGNSLTPAWVQKSEAPGDKVFISMSMDPKPTGSNKIRLWGGVSWYEHTTNGAGNNRVYESVDDGATWTSVSTGLPDGPVNVLVYDDRARILYAGTDAGVYFLKVDATPREWHCFSKNLPNTVVTDLEINYCTGKIYAACLGRGGFSSDLQPNDSWNDANDTYSTEVISTNTTWDQSRSVFKTVIVQSGAKLTIKPPTNVNSITINMGRKTHIIVEPGATLVIEKARLTNECNGMWGGIVVKGIPGQGQNMTNVNSTEFSNQGLVKLKDGAIIENAYVGIFIGNVWYDHYNPAKLADIDLPRYAGGSEGGLILSTGSTVANGPRFINCGNAVHISGYNKVQKSSFVKTSFIANGPLQHLRYTDYKASTPARFGTHSFIVSWSNNGVSFDNCEFKTVLTQAFSPRIDLRGNGFNTFNAGFTVTNCTFDKLSRGLMCGGSLAPYSPHVTGSTFTDIWRSASFRGVRNPVFRNNTVTMENNTCQYAQFDMDEGATSLFGLNQFGIYCSAGNGFTIRNNTITSNAASLPNHGIMLNNTNNGSNLAINRLYRNTLNQTKAGISLFQDAKGAQVKCNHFTNGYHNIFVGGSPWLQGEISDQGTCLPSNQTGAVSSPAGNSFNAGYSNPCTTAQHLGSAWGNMPYDFYYCQHGNNPYKVNCYTHSSNSTPVNTPINCFVSCTSYTECCPANPPGSTGGGGGKVQIDNTAPYHQAILSKMDEIMELEGMFDGGDRGSLIAAINNTSVSSSQLKTTLLNAGPYLSDYVLTSAIYRRTPPMIYEDLKEVILANSHLRRKVWDTLIIRYPDMETDDTVVAAQSNPSPRGGIEGLIRDLYAERNEWIEDLADHFISDEMFDSAAVLYMGYGGLEQAVPLFCLAGNISAGQAAAADIQNNQVKWLANLYLNRAQANRLFDTLTTAEDSLLTSLAGSIHTRGGEQARMWLLSAKGLMSQELVPIISNNSKSGNPGWEDEEQMTYKAASVLIYPNPAGNEVNIVVEEGLWQPGCAVIAYDMTGRRMATAVPEPGKQRVTLNSDTWAPGTYLILVRFGDGHERQSKVIIQK